MMHSLRSVILLLPLCFVGNRSKSAAECQGNVVEFHDAVMITPYTDCYAECKFVNFI